MRKFFSEKKRVTALFLAVVMLFSIISALCFIDATSHHDCIGHDCAICLQIAVCGRLLKISAPTTIIVAAIWLTMIFVTVLSRNRINESDNKTLVSLNIKITA